MMFSLAWLRLLANNCLVESRAVHVLIHAAVMNVLERIECDSSAESDVSEAEYDFNKASDDAIHSENCRLSHAESQ